MRHRATLPELDPMMFRIDPMSAEAGRILWAQTNFVESVEASTWPMCSIHRTSWHAASPSKPGPCGKWFVRQYAAS